MPRYHANTLGQGVVLKAPTADGPAGQPLVTDGAGQLSIKDPTLVQAIKPDTFDTLLEDMTDNTDALEAAIAAGGLVELPAGVIMFTRTINVPSDTVIRGAGSNLTQLYVSNYVSGLLWTKQSNINFEKFWITQRADPADYNTGGLGLLDGTSGGLGNPQPTPVSTNVNFIDLQITDGTMTGIGTYGGLSDSTIRGCYFARTGRGTCTGNGWQNVNFIGNRVYDSGDDGIALNNYCFSCSITGNVFVRCGFHTDGFDAAGIKVHNQDNAIVGNTFMDCAVGIYMKADYQSERYFNGYGANRRNTIANNTFNECKTSLVLHNCDGLIFDSNYISSLDGEEPSLGEWKRCRDITFINSTFIGSGFDSLDPATGMKFVNCTFKGTMASMNVDENYLFLINSKRYLDLDFKDCYFSKSIGSIVKGYSDDVVTIRSVGSRYCENVSLAWPADEITQGSDYTTLALQNASSLYSGVEKTMAIGRSLYLCKRGHKQKIVLSAACTRGDASIEVESFVADETYIPSASWITYGDCDPKSGYTTNWARLTSNSKVDIYQKNNEVDWGPISGTGIETQHTIGLNEGVNSPIGAVKPKTVGENYLDNVAVVWWKSTGLTNTDWVQIST